MSWTLKTNEGVKFKVSKKDAIKFIDKSCWLSSAGYPTYKHKNSRVYIHRVVAGAKKGQYVDHINGDILDATRENLQIISQAANLQKGQHKTGSSGYRGVVAFRGRWRASCSVDNSFKYLGVYDTPQEAAAAYNTYVRNRFGASAYVNKI